MILTPDNIDEEYVPRIVIAETFVGDRLELHASSSSIIESSHDDEASYRVSVEADFEFDEIDAFKEGASPHIKDYASGRELDEVVFVFTRIVPGREYDILFPIFVLEDILEPDYFLGAVEVFAGCQASKITKVTGIEGPNLIQTPNGLGKALMQGDDQMASHWRGRIRKNATPLVKPDYYSEWEARLGSCETLEEKEMSWGI